MDLITKGLYKHFINNRWDLTKNIFFVILIPFANIRLSQSIGSLLSEKTIDFGIPIFILVITIIAIQILHSTNHINNVKQSAKVSSIFNERIIKNMLYRELPSNNAPATVARDIFQIDTMWSFNSRFFTSLKDDLIQFIVFFIFAIYTFLNIDKLLGLSLLGFAIVTFYTIKRSIQKCRESGLKRDEQIGNLKSAVDDALNNTRFIKLNNREEEAYNKISNSTQNLRQYVLENVNCRTRYSNYLSVLFVFFVVITIYIIKRGKENGHIDKGDIVVVFFILSILMTYRERLATFQALLSESNGTIEGLRWALDEPERHRTVKDIAKFSEINRIDFEKLKLTKNQRFPIDLSARQGDIVCVVGGSSNLLYKITNLITGIDTPLEGRVVINRQEYRPDQIFEVTGFLLQDPDLFDKTIQENMFLETLFDKNILEKRLEEANLLMEYNLLIKKYKNNIGRRGQKIPMDSRRLIEIMRIVVKNPTLIVLDNPFEFFDQDTTNKIKNLITKWKEDGKIVFILQKDFFRFTNCDHIVNLSRYK